MQAITSAISFVDSDTGRNYTVRLIPENRLTDDPSRRFPVGRSDGGKAVCRSTSPTGKATRTPKPSTSGTCSTFAGKTSTVSCG